VTENPFQHLAPEEVKYMSLTTTLKAVKAATYDKLPAVLQNVLRSAVRTFIGAEVVLLPAVLAAPNVGAQENLFLAGTFAAGAAAIRLVEHGLAAYLGSKSAPAK